MKKIVLFIYILSSVVIHVYGQTMHSILFTNMEEQGREKDRTEELRNMTKFCNDIASAIGYSHDLRVHSGREFTSTVMERDISTLNVKNDDVVILYYAGHGCNWDDDDWPHMALLDRQYWETTAFSKLRSECKNAKLTLCIASCCNMDSRGRTGSYEYGYGYSSIDPQKARRLFLGFNDRLSIIASSSIRGQYTYSWTNGSRLGSIFSISLRDEIYDALTGKKSTPLNWTSIFEETKKRTLEYTKNYKQPQEPQYKIYVNNTGSSVVSPQRSTATTTPKAEIEDLKIDHNVEVGGIKHMAIHVKFKTHFMTEYGGYVAAFFDSPKGVGVKDTNGKYRTTGGNVCTRADFGSHYLHSRFNDFKLLIPNDELHASKGTHTYYIKVFIFDNKTQKYITNSDYISFSVTMN